MNIAVLIKNSIPSFASLLLCCVFLSCFSNNIEARAQYEFGFEDLSFNNGETQAGGVSSGAKLGVGEKRPNRLASVGAYLSQEEIDAKNQTDESPSEKTIGALLLKTGFVQKGKATLEKKLYIVEGTYSRIRIPANQVEYAAADIEEIYRYKLAKPGTDTYNGAYAMGKWCLSNGLFEEAIAEFERGKAYATYPQAVAKLDREIETVQKVRSNSVRHEEKKPSQLVAETPQNEPVTITQAEELPEELEDFGYKKWTASVPGELLGSFHKDVQPVLIKRCAGPDCHGANSSQEFRLEYPDRKYSSSEAAARNMKATLEWLDYENLSNSPVILKPLQEHGGVKPIFSEKSKKQLAAIYQWSSSVPDAMPEYVAQMKKRNAESEALFQQLQAKLPKPITPETTLAEREGTLVTENLPERSAADSGFRTIPKSPPKPSGIEQVSHVRPQAAAPHPSRRYEFPNENRSTEPSFEIEFRKNGFETAAPKNVPSGNQNIPRKNPRFRSGEHAPASDPFDPAVFNRAFHE